MKKQDEIIKWIKCFIVCIIIIQFGMMIMLLIGNEQAEERGFNDGVNFVKDLINEALKQGLITYTTSDQETGMDVWQTIEIREVCKEIQQNG